jgi:hypothetical protein
MGYEVVAAFNPNSAYSFPFHFWMPILKISRMGMRKHSTGV